MVYYRKILTVVMFLAFVGLLQARPRIFASFENESELSGIHPSGGVEISSSGRFALHQNHSLQVVFPATGGSVEFREIPRDWIRRGDISPSRGTPWSDEVLLLFVWSVEPEELSVTLSDISGSTYEKVIPLRTGANHVQLRHSRVENVDLRQMKSFSLSDKGAGTIYLDYFALDRFHQILDTKGRWDVDYSMELETPHVPWARPFAGGPISVFTIGNVRGAGRGIIELAQRLETDFRVTTLEISGFDFGDFYFHRRGGPSLSNTYLTDDFLNGPFYEVILWPDLRPWDSYPSEVRENIRQRVAGGAGLILFHPRTTGEEGNDLWEMSPLRAIASQDRDGSQWKPTAAHYITRGVPFDAFPWGHISVEEFEAKGEVLLATENGRPVLAVGTLGKGRIAAFSYRENGMIPAIEHPWETDLHYPYQEYLWSLLARTVIWASGKEPEASIQVLDQTRDAVRVGLSGTATDSVVEAQITDGLGEVQSVSEFPVGAKTEQLVVPLARQLPAGDLLVDFRLLSGSGTEDWASVKLPKESRASISEMHLENEKIEEGSQISGKIEIGNTSAEEALLTIRLFDNHNRLLDQQSKVLSVAREVEVPFELNPAGALTQLARIQTEVSIDSLRQDFRVREVFVKNPPRPWNDYEVIMYSGSNPLPGLWPTVDRQIQQFMVTALCWYPLDLVSHSNYRVQTSVMVSGTESPDGSDRAYYNQLKKRYAETRDKRVLVREHCLNDPAYYSLLREEIKDFVLPWVHLSPLIYFVYEEPSFTCYGDALDLCFSDHCMRAFRNWLKTGYGSVEEVNRQWKTEFIRWEEVVPDDTYEAQARGSFASWADHREFMDISLAKSYAFVGDELKKYDSNAIQLLSGTQEGVHSGQDYSRLDPLIGYIDAGAERMHRNFNPDMKLSVNGRAGAPGKMALYNIYSGLFDGASDGAFLFWQYSMLNPDYTINLTSSDTIAALRELRHEGIGKLVGLAELDNYGIALHYSYPSRRGAWIVDGVISEEVSYDSSKTYSRFMDNWQGWPEILTDAGLQFDHLAYKAIENGELITKGYKTLILPMSIALSDREVEAIRNFVELGGQVIADALPGVMDRHCTFRDERVLDEVFGINFTTVGSDGIIAMSGEPLLDLAGAVSRPDVNGNSVFFEHRYGAGSAYFLNNFLDRYPIERLSGNAEPMLLKMKQLLETAGIQPKVHVTTLAGDPESAISVYLYRVGSARMLGLMPDKYLAGHQKIRVNFTGASAIYDVRGRHHAGRGEFFETEVEAAVPKLFALLPKRVTGMEIQAPNIVHLGDEVKADYRITGVDDLLSVAKVEVQDPHGQVLRYYSGNRDILESRGTTSFRIALNDPPGNWQITVTEVMSGEVERAMIRVQD